MRDAAQRRHLMEQDAGAKRRWCRKLQNAPPHFGGQGPPQIQQREEDSVLLLTSPQIVVTGGTVPFSARHVGHTGSVHSHIVPSATGTITLPPLHGDGAFMHNATDASVPGHVGFALPGTVRFMYRCNAVVVFLNGRMLGFVSVVVVLFVSTPPLLSPVID